MEYTSVEGPDGNEGRIPTEHAEDEERRQAHEWLRRLAEPHYNRMLAAERDGRIPEALAAARSATRYGAFAPRILRSAFLVATKHGDFAFAQQLLSRLRNLEIDESAEYESLLRQRVERWNTLLGDSSALREIYQQQNVSPSYRELLLLADCLDGPPTETEQSHLAEVGLADLKATPSKPVAVEIATASWATTQIATALVAACFMGILFGGASIYFLSGGKQSTVENTDTSSSTTLASSAQRNRYVAALRVSTLLAEERSVEAFRVLGRLPPDGPAAEKIDSLRTATHGALYRTGMRAWKDENYERVVQALSPIKNTEVGRAQERLYRLGVAAAQTERDTLAVEVLRDLMPVIDKQHPHYEAQAAYLLVERGPPEVARRYARLIAEKYSDTLYFNSVVRDRLETL